MKIEIKTSRCKQCGLCLANCPKKVLSFAEEPNKDGYRPVQVDEAGCIACGFCYLTCPDGVFNIKG